MNIYKNLQRLSIEANKKYAFIFILITHIIAIIFTEGFHRPDEHLANFRMMSFKLGDFPRELLSWEFPAMIRPWLHPGLFYCIAKFLQIFSLENPFFLAFTLRAISSLFAIFATWQLIKKYSFFIDEKDEKYEKLAIWLTATISYLPFFHARTTAENWGMSFFLLGMTLLLKQNLHKKEYYNISFSKCFLAGFLFGISFIFRFQMGIMVLTCALWFLVFRKFKIINFITLSLGIIFAIGINVILDYWGYGVWTFTPWNYLYHNLILGRASGFGVSPFWYYLTKTFSKGIPPLSLIYLFSFLFIWFKRPNSLLSWTTLPFLIIHSLIGHKELRFIFGLGSFLPLTIVILIGNFEKHISNFSTRTWFKALIILVLIENFTFMTISSLKPAYTPMPFYKHLYFKEFTPKKMYTLRVFRDQLKFYLKRPIEWIYLKDQSKIKDLIQTEDTWFLTNNYSDITMMRKFKNCNEDYISYPDWIFKFNYRNWLNRSKIWALYICKGT